ncbi:hypothetical protein FA95DRAFT_775993 [Auriscalpium vulgare]|uniref:Uncharacterized protein n=1 Tax=Auriscalpium vulgare TaxID=40419 RepID=A0ACB8S133_9AGAM|nr:hypothetical protein FA95DRAFT_775993 [Auriscalpium vulgare]
MAFSTQRLPQRVPTTPLTYSIAGSSEHSSRYTPEKVLVNAPTDQNSRWSGVHESPTACKQWLLLRLDALSVVGQCLHSHAIAQVDHCELRVVFQSVSRLERCVVLRPCSKGL